MHRNTEWPSETGTQPHQPSLKEPPSLKLVRMHLCVILWILSWIPVFSVPHSSRQSSNVLASGFLRELQRVLGWCETFPGALGVVFLSLWPSWSCSGSRAKLSTEKVCVPCSLRSKVSSSVSLHWGLFYCLWRGKKLFFYPSRFFQLF